ncbi:MAG: PAS domain S-box protein [Candidatus Aureabacteria bacterium]|nr:PAS domain S-box protein [Candidatus Auribacterota bacterium]
MGRQKYIRNKIKTNKTGSQDKALSSRSAADKRSSLFSISNQSFFRKIHLSTEELFKMAFEQGPLGRAWSDKNGRFVIANKAFCRMLGYSEKEMIKLTFKDITHPEDLKKDLPQVTRLQQGEISLYQTEKRYITKKGDVFWGSLTLSVLRDNQDRFVNFMIMLEDINQRKASEAALIESEQRYRKIVASVTDYIYSVHIKKGKALYTEHSSTCIAVTGYSKEQFDSDPYLWINMVVPEDRGAVKAHAAKILSGKDPGPIQHRIIRKDGHLRWVNNLPVLHLNSKGKLASYDGLIRDITERKHSEENLRESENKFSKAFYNNPSLMAVSTVNEGRFLEVNDAFLTTLGYSREEVIGKTSQELGIFKNIKKREEVLQLLNKKTGVKNFEADVLTKNKELRSLSFSADFLELHNQTLLLTVGTDITDKQTAETELKRTLDATTEGIWKWNLTTNSISFSPRYYTMLGYEPDEFPATYENWKNLLHPDDLDQALKTAQEYLSTKPDQYENEFRLKTKNGAYRWIHARGTVVERDEHRQAVLLIGNHQDITDRKHAELSQEAEKERLHVTLRSIGDAVITTDLNGLVILMNREAEKLTGWTQDEALGKRFFEVFQLVDKTTGKGIESPVEKALATGMIMEIPPQTLLIARDGSQRLIADSTAPIRDKDSNVIGAVLVFRDITLKQKTEDELYRMKQIESLGILAGGIAHDFNNLLSITLGNIDLARHDTIQSGENEKFIYFLTEAQKGILRARELAQQLLTFSKGGSPVKKRAALDRLLQESVTFTCRGSNVKTVLIIEKNLWKVEMDTGQIHQVIQNIVINAVQAMKEGGNLEVSAENLELKKEENALPLAPGKYVRVSLKDTGCGISHKDISKIFTPYYSTKSDGSGLGLAIAYSIIKKHFGYILAESALNKGTTFTFFLPAIQEERLNFEGLVSAHEPVQGSGERILVMDDEPMVLDIFSRILQTLGFQVETAREGNEALKKYQDARLSGQSFDAVILDMTIAGGMGGEKTVKKLLEINPGIKAIVTSGYSNSDILANYKDYGFLAMLKKPFQIEEISEVLKQIFHQ